MWKIGDSEDEKKNNEVTREVRLGWGLGGKIKATGQVTFKI